MRRFVTGGMSLGALSREAHETLAMGVNRAGGRSNSGEGGEDEARWSPITDADDAGPAVFDEMEQLVRARRPRSRTACTSGSSGRRQGREAQGARRPRSQGGLHHPRRRLEQASHSPDLGLLLAAPGPVRKGPASGIGDPDQADPGLPHKRRVRDQGQHQDDRGGARRRLLLDRREKELGDFVTMVYDQDQPVVESQRPEELPEDLSEEIHLKGVDTFSVDYRRWLLALADELEG